jgi:hypothetical protein
MRTIITAEDIKKYRDISDYAPAAKLMPFIHDAQLSDLRQILGKPLWKKVVENVSPLNYPELDQHIIPVLAFYAYSRYVQQGQVNVTAFGAAQYNTDFSSATSEKTIARVTANAEQLALIYVEDLTEFLDKNAADYPEWKPKCGRKGKGGGTVRYSVVGNDIDINDFVKDEVNKGHGNIIFKR